MKRVHSEAKLVTTLKFWALCLIPAAIILFLPLSKWSVLIWTGGFIGGGSVFAIISVLYSLAKD